MSKVRLINLVLRFQMHPFYQSLLISSLCRQLFGYLGFSPFYATSSEILLNFSSPVFLYAVICCNSLLFSVLFAYMFFLKIWNFLSKMFIAFSILRKILLGVYDLIIFYISYILLLKKVSWPDNIVLVMKAMVVMVMKMCCRPGLRLSPLLWFTKRFFKICRCLQNFSVVFAKSGNVSRLALIKFLPFFVFLFYLMFHFVLIAIQCSKHLYFCSVIICCLLKFSHIDSFVLFFQIFEFLFFFILFGGVVVLKFSIFYNSQYLELFFVV